MTFDDIGLAELCLQSSWGKGYVEAFFLQTLADAADVGGVPGFDDAVDEDGVDIFTDEGTVVLDIVHAGAFIGQQSGESGETARPIADDSAETAEAAVRRQAALDDAPEDVGIDVAAAKREHDFFAGQIGDEFVEAGCERCRARAFHDSFFQFHEPQDSQSDVALAHSKNAVDKRTSNLEGVVADLWNGEAVSEGGLHGNEDRPASLEGGGVTGGAVGFHANDFHGGFPGF